MIIDRRHFIGLLLATASSDWFAAAHANRAQHRVIPSSGEALPVVGLGTWLTFGIDPQNSGSVTRRCAVVDEFLRLGGGMIDSSPMYGHAEQVVGICLRPVKNRAGLFAASKVWTHGDREGTLQMEQSRIYWGLPQLDLVQVHNLMDWQTHLPRLQAMKQAGRIRYLGVTTSHGRRHEELVHIMKTQRLDFVQFTYNLLDREAESYLLPLARERGIGVIINRPFQRGGLFDHVARRPLPPWAAEIDCRYWSQLFLKFILSHPAVTCAIPATSRVDHLRQNMAAAYGPMPDTSMRRKIIEYVQNL